MRSLTVWVTGLAVFGLVYMFHFATAEDKKEQKREVQLAGIQVINGIPDDYISADEIGKKPVKHLAPVAALVDEIVSEHFEVGYQITYEGDKATLEVAIEEQSIFQNGTVLLQARQLADCPVNSTFAVESKLLVANRKIVQDSVKEVVILWAKLRKPTGLDPNTKVKDVLVTRNDLAGMDYACYNVLLDLAKQPTVVGQR